MQASKFKRAALGVSLASTLAVPFVSFAETEEGRAHGDFKTGIKHVMLISIDGFHQIDLANCIKGGYCPNMEALTKHGLEYTAALTAAPSDSFPGLIALTTGASTRSAGVFYDVSFDRALQAPIAGTPFQGGPAYTPAACSAGAAPTGTIVEYDEYADANNTVLESGGLNPDFLPRDPATCNPVYPHSFLRVNTIFEVVKAAGGYTAWTDKHPAYEILNGPSGHGVDDFYGPEINSNPVDEFQATKTDACTLTGMPIDLAPGSGSQYTESFQNIRCYDSVHVRAVLNQIQGLTHDGKPAKVPTVFGTNFQAVSVGQKLFQKSLGLTGGYVDAQGTPSASLKDEIVFVDTQIGKFITALVAHRLDRSTLVVIGAKHGQSSVDPNNLVRIPRDQGSAPSKLLASAGFDVANADEDDLSLIWLSKPAQTADATKYLDTQQANFGRGVVYSGEALKQIFNDPAKDSRAPDIFVESTPGVVYTGGSKKVSEHGGFAHYDRAAALIVSNPGLKPAVINQQVDHAQVAPTILRALGISPATLLAVRQEGTQVLPGLFREH